MISNLATRIPYTLGSWSLILLGGLMTGACQHSPSETKDDGTFEIINGDQYAFRGVGKIKNLSSQEQTLLQSDMQYLHSLVPTGVPVTLNHADERQHRFVMTRLKMAGKTRANSPALFQMLDNIRAQHLSKGLQSRTLLASENSSTRTNKHYIGSLNIKNTTMEVIGSGSIQDTIYYGYVDAGAWDANDAPLGDVIYSEIYGNMPY